PFHSATSGWGSDQGRHVADHVQAVFEFRRSAAGHDCRLDERLLPRLEGTARIRLPTVRKQQNGRQQVLQEARWRDADERHSEKRALSWRAAARKKRAP